MINFLKRIFNKVKPTCYNIKDPKLRYYVVKNLTLYYEIHNRDAIDLSKLESESAALEQISMILNTYEEKTKKDSLALLDTMMSATLQLRQEDHALDTILEGYNNGTMH